MSVALSLIISIAMVIAVLFMLRRGMLREKYTVLWLVVGGLTIILGFFPKLLDLAAHSVGVLVPSNLLFAMSILLLVGVSLHVSHELTVLEDETRILAEEVSILRTMVERSLDSATPQQSPQTDTATPAEAVQTSKDNPDDH